MALPTGVTVVQGKLDASGLSVAIVVARFNAFITEPLLDGAVDTLVRHGARATDLTVVRVPGAFEVPMAAQHLADSGRFDAVVGLGCLMRGDTIHFELIAGEVTKGLAQVAMNARIPISFGVLTTDTLEQAVHRAGAKAGNKGGEAAMAAVEQVGVLRALASGSATSKPATKKAAKKAAKKATKSATRGKRKAAKKKAGRSLA